MTRAFCEREDVADRVGVRRLKVEVFLDRTVEKRFFFVVMPEILS